MLMGGGRLQELVALEVYSNYRPIGRGVMGALAPPPPQTPEVHFFLLTNPSPLFYSLHFSCSSFFAQKLHRNTCYAGYLQMPLMGSFQFITRGGSQVLFLLKEIVVCIVLFCVALLALRVV